MRSLWCKSNWTNWFYHMDYMCCTTVIANYEVNDQICALMLSKVAAIEVRYHSACSERICLILPDPLFALSFKEKKELDLPATCKSWSWLKINHRVHLPFEISVWFHKKKNNQMKYSKDTIIAAYIIHTSQKLLRFPAYLAYIFVGHAS